MGLTGGALAQRPLPPRQIAVHAGASTISAVERLLDGIPQVGDALGRAHAPVTLQVFGDLECPICKEFALGAEPGLIRRYVRTGKLKIEALSMESATHEVETFRNQQIAALAAGRQDRMWYFIELFYREQGEEGSGYVTEAYLQGLAQQVPGLDLSMWNAARNEPALEEELNRSERIADRWGFPGTPSFLIGRTGGRLRLLRPESFIETSSFTAAIKKLLRRR
jgi:protein-disulfide isomerase